MQPFNKIDTPATVYRIRMALSMKASSILGSKSSDVVPASVVMPTMKSSQITKMKKHPKSKTERERHVLTERNRSLTLSHALGSPNGLSRKTTQFGNKKYFMSPENRRSSKKSGVKKEHTPRTMKKMQKQHRDNERNRHQGMNAIIHDLSLMVPGHGQYGKETKIHTLKKLISYICHLEEYTMKMVTEMGLEADFHDLLLMPYMTENDIEDNRYVSPIRKVAVTVPARKRPAEDSLFSEIEKCRKLSSPTIDSTTIEVPVGQLGQAFIQLENGKMAPIGTVQQSRDGSNYITIPEIVTTSAMYRGGTILIPSVVDIEEFQACRKYKDQETMCAATKSSPNGSLKATESSDKIKAQIPAAFGSPVLISPFGSPQGPKTPFLRNNGDATPLLSQSSLSVLSSPVLKSPYSAFSHHSNSGTPSKMVDSTTMTTLASQSELSMPLPDQEEETEEPTILSPTNYLSALTLIRNSQQDIASYAAEFSDDSVLDDDPLDEPVFYGSYKKKKPKQKKKKVYPYRKPRTLDHPFMFYGVGKYVNENPNYMRKSNNSAAASSFSKDVGSVSSSKSSYEWKFSNNTAELVHKSAVDGVASLQPTKLDHRKTSWMNGFMMFSRMHRRDFINVNPGTPTSQISKLLGQTWRGMNTEQQQPYKLKAKQYANNLSRMYNGPQEIPVTVKDEDKTSSAMSEPKMYSSGKTVTVLSTQSENMVPCSDGSVSIKREIMLDEDRNCPESDETNTASECEFATESNQDAVTESNDCSSIPNSCKNDEIVFTVNGNREFDYRVRIKIERSDEEEANVPNFYVTDCDSEGVVPKGIETVKFTGLSNSLHDHSVPDQPEPVIVNVGQCHADDDGQQVPSTPCRRQTAPDREGEPVEILSYGLELNEAEE